MIKRIITRAKALHKHIILSEGEDQRVLLAGAQAHKERLARITLVGNIHKIEIEAAHLGINLKGINLLDTDCAEHLWPQLWKNLYEKRKDKGMTEAQAHKLAQDPAYFSALLVDSGYADAFISGAEHATSNTLKAALDVIGTKHYASSSMLMILPNGKEYLFADCGFNIDPDAMQLAQIAVSTADTAVLLGMKPKVAILSFSTKGSGGRNAHTEKIHVAAQLLKRSLPELPSDGELQVDAALDPTVADRKMPLGHLHGDANILIFPDLNAGNIGYKLVQRLGGARAVGPILQGFNKPACDLSRGCTVQEIKDAIAITAAQCTTQENLQNRFEWKRMDRK
ncbi:MAG: phosphate acetyltransferase [Nitrosarchaeum sp.]|nr:phosphate acetyltransferase [Nitrosarchaeum sp.]